VLGAGAVELPRQQGPLAPELHNQREKLDVLLKGPLALFYAGIGVVDPSLPTLLEGPEKTPLRTCK
jgi:hypothetical protein